MNKTLFKTDFYQLSMVVAYMLNDMANDRTGFEAYVRRVKPATNKAGTHYLMAGSSDVFEAMAEIEEDLQDMPALFELFWDIIHLRVDDKFYKPLKEKWVELDTNFKFNVLLDTNVIKPYVPIFQYDGPKWIGQLIETLVLNTLNGKIGFNTLVFADNAIDLETQHRIATIVDGDRDALIYQHYLRKVEGRLEEFRDSTDAMLLEAAFRRSPSYNIAVDAAALAVNDFGWNGTSNVAAYLEGLVTLDKIGGSCAHSFIMSFVREIDAFRAWNMVFPNLTILIDTYDTLQAVRDLVKYGIKPSDVRIDSEPLDMLATKVRAILDANGWQDVGIFLSGDMTPERLSEFGSRIIPMNKTMAGTMLVNIDDVACVNAGMVYKLVEFESNGIVHYPEKKSTGKGSVKALKKLVVDNNGYHFEKGFDLTQAANLEPSTVYDNNNNFTEEK